MPARPRRGAADRRSRSRAGPQAAQRELLDLAYEALRRWRDRDAPPERLGVEALAGADTAQDLIRQIDREFYSRSLAHYERSFKIAAQ